MKALAISLVLLLVAACSAACTSSPREDTRADAAPDALIAWEDAARTDGGESGGSGGEDSAVPACSAASPCPAAMPICDAATGTCGACADNQACAMLSSSAPYCEPASGRCVACLAHGDCPSSAPACVAGACVACDAPGAAADACAMRDGAAPVCAAGACVQCGVSADCQQTSKPICAANTCRACEADAECVAKLGADPGVCMRHEDGRCAAAAETVVVENLSTKCGVGAGAGTAAMPLCGLQQGLDAAKAQSKPLVVLKGPAAVDRATWAGPGKVSLVGKLGGLVRGGAGPGFQASGGEAYVRDITFEAGDPGLKVTAGASLHGESLRIVGNPGGGVLVEDGKLVLERTVVSNNGPAPFPAWGGIFSQSPAAGTRLERVSVTDNEISGVSCSTAIEGSGVLSTGHGNSAAANITPSCGFMSCGSASPTCGAP